ncbi:MAG: histidine phosphatase family protein [Bryobacteraceae bacterium]
MIRIVALLLATCAWGADPTTILLVRHAEKSAGEGDVTITELGTRRAEALARMLQDAGVKAIYTSHFKRTQQTARPLATALHLEPSVLDDAAAIAADIRIHHAGQTVLVVHHANTVPQIAAAFGVQGSEPFRDMTYDRLFIVITQADGTTKLIALHYGPQPGDR